MLSTGDGSQSICDQWRTGNSNDCEGHFIENQLMSAFYLGNESVYVSSEPCEPLHRCSRFIVWRLLEPSKRGYRFVVTGGVSRYPWWSVQRSLVYTLNPVCGVVAAYGSAISLQCYWIPLQYCVLVVLQETVVVVRFRSTILSQYSGLRAQYQWFLALSLSSTLILQCYYPVVVP